MSQYPPCEQCGSIYVYLDGNVCTCPECGHESIEGEQNVQEQDAHITDVNGNVLQDGDSVLLVKDLKVKGSSSILKVGTKVKNIRLVDGDHDIDCKITGFGPMKLKSSVVKKVLS